ncbi:DUF3800 domain-containing protein [Acetobacter sp. DsW_54]|uniref:DUF3800 domain-containing protein n=1 Tax=Acetobacter sp. DsW_54 TaxID=1670660 RepID=UPI000A3905C1|nr:DUF3800 domain-containing protein [Acetobacter sp. DsW_54]OUI98322.1 hypothetical protein HK20_07355 [Acetobacter sp. DsW_54]
MKFEVYCDETHPDLFMSGNPRARYLTIGSLWLPADLRADAKEKIYRLRELHSVWGEVKWTKISPSKVDFYFELINLFMSYGMDMRFRCIAVDRTQVNLALHDGDGELGFYKFYYQLLHHWILDFNEYRIFCDLKSNRDRTRLGLLKRCLCYANKSSKIADIQSLPSSEVALLQLSDVLLGAASSRLNNTLKQGSAKESLVKLLETRLDLRRPLEATGAAEKKFNIFKIRLEGGW